MMIVIQDLRVFFTSLTRKTKGNQEISAENEKNSENQISSAFECLLESAESEIHITKWH